MEIENCTKDDLKEVVITARITLKMREFMKSKRLSPSKIMREALINLGFEEQFLISKRFKQVLYIGLTWENKRTPKREQ